MGYDLSHLASICVVDHNVASSPDSGSWEIYAHERIRFVGAGVDTTSVPGASVIPLLPDDGVRFRLTRFHVPNPVLTTISDDTSEGIHFSATPQYYGSVNGTGVLVHYYGPTTRDIYAPPAEHDKTVNWTDEDSDNEGITYDRMGPISGFGDTSNEQSTDTLAGEIPLILAEKFAPNDALPSAVGQYVAVQQSVTPNIIYGFSFDEAQVTGNASMLGPTAATAASTMPLEMNGRITRGVGEIKPLALDSESSPIPLTVSSPPESEQVEGMPPAPPAPTESTTRAGGPLPAAEREGSVPLLAAASAVAAAAILAILVLYRRLKNESLAAQRSRKSILEIVASQPGIRVQAIAASVGMSHKGVDYHLHLLGLGSLVQVRRSFGQTRVYPTGLQPRSDEEARRRAALDHPLASAIVAYARERPVTRRELLGIVTPPAPRATLNWHVRRLVEVGALVEQRETGALAATNP